MLQHPQLPIALVIVGVILNQYAYLHDVIVGKHEGMIIMGTSTYGLALIGLVVLIAGVVLMSRRRAETAETKTETQIANRRGVATDRGASLGLPRFLTGRRVAPGVPGR